MKKHVTRTVPQKAFSSLSVIFGIVRHVLRFFVTPLPQVWLHLLPGPNLLQTNEAERDMQSLLKKSLQLA